MRAINFVCMVLVIYPVFTVSAMAKPKASAEFSNQQKTAVEIISSAMSDPSPYIRARAIEAAIRTKYRPFVEQIEKLLKDDFIPVRFTAAIAVGEFNDKNSTSILQNLIEKGDETSQIGAAYGFAKLGNKKYIPLIIKALSSDDQNLRANAAMLLGKLGDKSFLEPLYMVLRDEKATDAVMFSAAEAIATLKDDSIYERLWTLLISKHADDRLIGVGAMGSLGTRPAKDALLTMLYDEILEVRLAAAGELGKLGDQNGWPEVYDALTKPISAIQKETILRNQKNKDQNDVSQNKQDDKNPDMSVEPEAIQRVKILSALAIGYINNENLNPFLPELLREKDAAIRLAAAQSALLIKD